MSKTGEDCFFYIHGNCRNGDTCQFRHSKECLLTQEPCREWITGNCHLVLCPKRHPQLSTTPICKFENSPTGCLNKKCSYRHLKPMEATKLPLALAEALKKSVSQTNGDKASPIIRKHTPVPVQNNFIEQTQIENKPHLVINKTIEPVVYNTSTTKTTTKLSLKPIIEKPAPIPIVNLRSGDEPSYNPHSSSALMSNLKVLTTHSDTNTSERHIPTPIRPSKLIKNSNLKSPPSPITFEDRPRKLSPITFNSDTKSNAPGVKRSRSIKIGTQVNSSPQEEKPSMKRLKIKTESPLVETVPPDITMDYPMTSPILSPLDSTAYFGNSLSESIGCSISDSINGSQSDDVRIEDQIEDLLNANFSPKPSENEVDLGDLQDSDDIFLQLEDLIS